MDICPACGSDLEELTYSQTLWCDDCSRKWSEDEIENFEYECDDDVPF